MTLIAFRKRALHLHSYKGFFHTTCSPHLAFDAYHVAENSSSFVVSFLEQRQSARLGVVGGDGIGRTQHSRAGDQVFDFGSSQTDDLEMIHVAYYLGAPQYWHVTTTSWLSVRIM